MTESFYIKKNTPLYAEENVEVCVLLLGNMTRYNSFIPLIQKTKDLLGFKWNFIISLQMKPLIAEQAFLKEKSQIIFLKKLQQLGNVYHLQNLDYNLRNFFEKNIPTLKFLILFDDTSLIDRAFINAAKSFGVLCLYYQRATMSVTLPSLLSFERLKHVQSWFKQLPEFSYKFKYYYFTLQAKNNSITAFYYLIKEIFNTVFHSGSYEDGKHSDYHFVYGRNDKDFLIANGIKPNRIFTIGNSFLFDIWDKVYRNRNDKEQILKIYETLKIDSEVKNIITFATQAMVGHGVWNEHQRDIYTISILKTLKKFIQMQNKKYTIILKVHPGESVEYYIDLVRKEKLELLCVVTRDEPIENILTISSVWIVGFSSTIYFAILCNIPIILTNLFKERESIDFHKEKAILYATSLKMLSNYLRLIGDETNGYKVLFNKYRKDFIEKYITNEIENGLSPLDLFIKTINENFLK